MGSSGYSSKTISFVPRVVEDHTHSITVDLDPHEVTLEGEELHLTSTEVSALRG